MTTRPHSGELRALRDREAAEVVRAQIEHYRRSGDLGDGIHVEPRCRVCKTNAVRQTVNRMLAQGLTYQEILRALEPHNSSVAKNQRVTYRSLWTHTSRHFRVHEPAKSIYRDIIERRALEDGLDVVEGVASIITAYGYLETMMTKGFHALIQDDTAVTPMEGMTAALKLRELLSADKGSDERKLGEMAVQMERIITAIREVVPDRYHEAIMAHVDGSTQPALDVEEVVDDDDDEFADDAPFDEDDDEEDDF